MAATYTPIASITLGATASSVTFSSIPSTYTDLVLVASTTNTSAAGNNLMRLNSDTGSNYSRTRLTGNGTSATTGRGTSETTLYFGDTGNPSNFSTTIYHLMNYANTTTNKTILARSGAGDVQVHLVTGLWRNTAAINTILLYPESNNYSSGSTFNLYGILAGS